MSSTVSTKARWRSSTPARQLGVLSRVLALVGLAGLIGVYLFNISPLFSRFETTYADTVAGADFDALTVATLDGTEVLSVQTSLVLHTRFAGDCGVAAVEISPDQFPQVAGHSDLRVFIVNNGAGG